MWDVFKDWIFDIIQFFYFMCHDWGLAIIIVTIIFRALVSPLMYKQAKSTYQMQKIQPQIQSIQQRFADDKIRQSEEMQKIYANTKFNPLTGCLPMLLQMPIFVALFQVLREMGTRTGETSPTFYNIVPNLTISPSDAISLSIGEFIPYMVLLLIFAGATFLPMALQQMRAEGNNSQGKQTMIFAGIMSVFMLWVGWGSPGGVLLFWGVSSLLGILQNQLSIRHFKKKDEREAKDIIEVQPVEVSVTRKAKKPRPKKKH